MVIMIMGLSVALVVPSLVVDDASTLRDESRRLQQTLRLLAEEVELKGEPVRFVAEKGGYHFEQLDAEQKWLPIAESPFVHYQLQTGVNISALQHAAIAFHGSETLSDAMVSSAPMADGDSSVEVVGSIIFQPGNRIPLSDIVLAFPQNNAITEQHLEVRPGPGGIRLRSVDAH